jgi:hypothetical protein
MKRETINKANELIKEISITETIEEQVRETRLIAFKNRNSNYLFNILVGNKRSSSRIDEALTRATEEFLGRLQDIVKITKLQLKLELDDLKDTDTNPGKQAGEETE